MKIAKNKLTGNKFNLLVIVGVLVIFLLAGSRPNVDFAKAVNNYVGGWAWGGSQSATTTTNPIAAYDGIGWINFGNYDFIDYGVTIPNAPTTGSLPLSGKAWSELYGWLSFNSTDVSVCPYGAGANIDSTGKIRGFARLLSIKYDYESVPSNSGGWKGCVSLGGVINDGSGNTYGVTKNGNSFSGYAWSDELGWIDFSGLGLDRIVTISPMNTTLTVGQSVTLSSTATFADGSIVGHNMNWKNTNSNCWNWETTCTNSGATLTNSANVLSPSVNSHTLSSVFTGTAVGTYSVYAAATSSLLTDPFWVSSPIATISVIDSNSCTLFGQPVAVGTSVTTHNGSGTSCSNVTSTCTGNPASFNVTPGALAGGCGGSALGVPSGATPVSISVNSTTVNPGDKVAVTWDILNPDTNSLCVITASTTNQTETDRLNLLLSLSTAKTDTNDPYGPNRDLLNALKTPYVAGKDSKGQISVNVNYPTTFNLSCNGTTVTKKTIINVTKNREG